MLYCPELEPLGHLVQVTYHNHFASILHTYCFLHLISLPHSARLRKEQSEHLFSAPVHQPKELVGTRSGVSPSLCREKYNMHSLVSQRKRGEEDIPQGAASG